MLQYIHKKHIQNILLAKENFINPALKKKIYHYAMVTLACAIMGIAMNTFYMPNKMLSGGIGGVAVLAYYVAGLPMGATSLICNVPLFFISYCHTF